MRARLATAHAKLDRHETALSRLELKVGAALARLDAKPGRVRRRVRGLEPTPRSSTPGTAEP